MASIISSNIDLTKINKSKIYEGKKGKYYPITIVLNDEPGQYGDSGYIMTEQTKDERDAKAQKEYLGNVKVVWTNGQNVTTADKQGTQQSIEMQNVKQEEPDLPF
ncbi:MAG: hypothetical protein GOVbin15_40 [Prokaryotic dsDNA virus sp.]|nr:MAG: hypothetical protein GOVbin15_40 [Prokaryotic dsDNA virus sp.]|tara:strand:+ start:1197 stop:1511 length:315 start_codon:yes stop_codon:yes gene_type:complete